MVARTILFSKRKGKNFQMPAHLHVTLHTQRCIFRDLTSDRFTTLTGKTSVRGLKVAFLHKVTSIILSNLDQETSKPLAKLTCYLKEKVLLKLQHSQSSIHKTDSMAR